jgi:AraC-like DNA-binding protein
MILLYDFFFILGILLCGIYITIRHKSKNKTLSHHILAWFFVVLILVILDSYAFIHKINTLSIITFLPASSSKLLLGSLLFIYIKSLFYDDKIIIRKFWKVFIPLFLFLIFYSVPTLIALISKRNFLGYIDIKNNHNQLIRIILDIAFFVYLALCFNSFFKLKKIMKCTYSSISHNNFIWIRYLLIAAIVIISIDFIFVLSQVIFNAFALARTQNVIVLLLVISIIYAAYFGLKQSKVLVPYFLLENDDNSNINNKTQPINNNLILEFKALEKKLKRIFVEEKPYLNTELTLGKLAELTAISDKKLSALLNQHMNISFYDFVNSYRINAFKDVIKSDMYNKYTIETMAYQCGFKSKASFHRIFKTKMNMSPSEFKNNFN